MKISQWLWFGFFLVVLSCAQPKDPAGNKSSTSSVNSSNKACYRLDKSLCIERSTGGASCSADTWSTIKSCPLENTVGRCVIKQDNGGQANIYYYADLMTANSAKQDCQVVQKPLHGVFYSK
jgi:hypothetical protein